MLDSAVAWTHVQHLPPADPGLPDLRSASRFLGRDAWLQRWKVLGGTALGVLTGLGADTVSGLRVLRSIGGEAAFQGRTVVDIAHRLHTASDVDRVPVVEDGPVTELGSHDQLLALGGSSAALRRSWPSA